MRWRSVDRFTWTMNNEENEGLREVANYCIFYALHLRWDAIALGLRSTNMCTRRQEGSGICTRRAR